MPDVNKLDTPPSLTPVPTHSTSSTSRPATPTPTPTPAPAPIPTPQPPSSSSSRTPADTALLETEQEAQVARLLNLIRLQHLQSDTPAAPAPGENPTLVAASFIGDGGNVPWLGSAHSDMAFYVAESQMLARENEMLKRRIGELEGRVAELEAGAGAGAGAKEAGSEGGNEGGGGVQVEDQQALPDDFVHAL